MLKISGIEYFGLVPPQAQFFSAFYSSSRVFIPLITTATLLTLCATNLQRCMFSYPQRAPDNRVPFAAAGGAARDLWCTRAGPADVAPASKSPWRTARRQYAELGPESATYH